MEGIVTPMDTLSRLITQPKFARKQAARCTTKRRPADKNQGVAANGTSLAYEGIWGIIALK